MLARTIVALGLSALVCFVATLKTDVQAQEASAIRAVVPRASLKPIIDGALAEYDQSLCTPVEYFHSDLKNRPAQFYYLWDDEAFYVAVRTLDEHLYSPQETFWVGDAVEWYFDARRDANFLTGPWQPGAVHCFFSGLTLDKVEPRFMLRPGYENAIPKLGVKTAARRTAQGLEIEFKLPWSNFPAFKPAAGELIGLDAELSYSDGVSRSFRTFAFGNPLSVSLPANLARVQLVDAFDREHWKTCGPVMMPIRVDLPWSQTGLPQITALIAMPPNRGDEVGSVEFQLIGTSGDLISKYAADKDEILEEEGRFIRRKAKWPVSVAPASSYHVQAVVFAPDGRELTRIAPRLVSVNMEQGY
jgi:hypothetical protein